MPLIDDDSYPVGHCILLYVTVYGLVLQKITTESKQLLNQVVR